MNCEEKDNERDRKEKGVRRKGGRKSMSLVGAQNSIKFTKYVLYTTQK